MIGVCQAIVEYSTFLKLSFTQFTVPLVVFATLCFWSILYLEYLGYADTSGPVEVTITNFPCIY